MGTCSSPNDLVPEIRRPKHRVHEQLEVMAGGGVAVEVDAARRLQHAAQLHQARRHHHQVGHHRVAADELAEGGDHVLHRRRHRRVADDVPLEGELRLLRPLPGVGERADLRRRLLARPLPEQHIVGGVGVEGRVEVDKVNRLVGHMLPQHRQVVPVVERVGHQPLPSPAPAGRGNLQATPAQDLTTSHPQPPSLSAGTGPPAGSPRPPARRGCWVARQRRRRFRG